MNESMPIQWSGYPLYPSEPPEDYSADPCTWYWYKDPPTTSPSATGNATARPSRLARARSINIFNINN
jgi:hypothetical protein